MLPVILALAWPTMLEQFLQTAVQYIDTAMVGSLGTGATAAVGATSTVNWMIGSVVAAVSVGFLAYISQAFGAGDPDRARRASAQSVTVAAAAGILLTVLALSLSERIPVWMRADPGIRAAASRYFFILYIPMLFRAASIMFGTVLRAAGDTKTPMLVSVGVNVLNVVLNFFLIYPTREIALFGRTIVMPGAGGGVIGAAAASAAAYAVGGIAITVRFWRHPSVSPRGHSFRPDPEILRPCFRVALPNLLQRFATTMGYVVFASMINSLGETETAAHTIANTVESAFYIPGWGMQTAAATLAGNAWGAGDEPRLKRLSRTVIPLEICLMVVSGGLLFLLAPQLIRIFTKDPDVILLGVTVLRMVALSEPFYGVPIVVEGMMEGVGNTVPPFVFNVACMWGVRIAGTYLMTQVLSHGLVAAWGCMIAHNLTLFLLFSFWYLTGRWKPRPKNVPGDPVP